MTKKTKKLSDKAMDKAKGGNLAAVAAGARAASRDLRNQLNDMKDILDEKKKKRGMMADLKDDKA